MYIALEIIAYRFSSWSCSSSVTRGTIGTLCEKSDEEGRGNGGVLINGEHLLTGGPTEPTSPVSPLAPGVP